MTYFTYNIRTFLFIALLVLFTNLLIVVDVFAGNILTKKVNGLSFNKPAAITAEQIAKENKEKRIYNTILSDMNSKRAVLSDAIGGVGEGVAHISRKNGKVSHYIYAYNLADLPKNYWYEGWLVQTTPSQKIISTGRLEKISEGTYALFFSHDKELLGHDLVVVTRETSTKKYDGTGPHIIEGSVE